MSKRTPNFIDEHIGRRIRLRRLSTNISQQKLGDAIGVSFQQIQKYECGRDRIGAGRLQAIADALDVPITYFYQEKSSASPSLVQEEAARIAEFFGSREGAALASAFGRIRDDKVRRKLVELAIAFAEANAA